jgi:uncharacterized protein (DUF697 family)
MLRIAARDLLVHPHAQRVIVPSNLKDLIDKMDLDSLGVFHAVEATIGGVHGIYLVDGQHRQNALLACELGDWIVDVKVHLSVTTDAGACALFLRLNSRAAVSPFDKFEKEVTAGFPAAMGVVRLMKPLSLILNRNGKDGSISCVTALKRVYGMDAGESLKRTLDTVLAAWGRTASAVEGVIIEGVGFVYGQYGAAVDSIALAKKLAKYPGGAPAMIGDARGLKNARKASVAHCLAEIVLQAYNVGRRSGRLGQN